MEKRQPYVRNQGRRDGWCWLVAGLHVKVLSPDTQNGILQVTLMQMETVQFQMAVQILGGVSSASEAEEIEAPVAVGVLPVRPSVAAQRAGFGQLDHRDISEVFSCRASVMRTVPRFLWGSFRVALKVALEEIRVGHSTRNTQRQEPGWKIVLALAPNVVASFTKGRPDQQGQVDWQI